MLRCLRLINQHHSRRGKRGNLPHQLASNTSGGARNQNALARQHIGHLIHINRDFIARQEVVNADWLQIVHRAILCPLLCLGQHQNLHTLLNQQVL